MKPRHVLVTGGAGFIGSHLCEALLARGDRVTSLDNYMTGSPENFAGLRDNPRFTALEHDITAPIELAVDQIYNLACPASPVHYQRDPIHTVRTCVLGAINMLELARRCDAPILQASTSEVYGDPELHPQPESYRGNVSSIGPRACYDEGKRCAEALFYDYRRLFGLRIRVVRIFNTYGPRMRRDDGRAVSAFVQQALNGQPIEIYGDGRQTRSFCYVDDLVAGLIATMASEAAAESPMNLGNPEEVTIADLAAQVIALTGSDSPLIHLPLPEDDPRRRRPDITLARQRIGFVPRVPLSEGLERTIRDFRSRPPGQG